MSTTSIEEVSTAARRYDAWSVGLFAVVSAGLFIAAIVQDVRLPLWTDELFTLFVSEQQTIPDLFSAVRDGMDNQPPLYALTVRALRPIVVLDSLRVRLASTVGFFVMYGCVYIFARKRLPAPYAVLSVLLVVRLVWPYAFEGRAYGALLGCVSLALVCWQAAGQTRNAVARAGLGFSLAAAVAFNYFATFVIGALLIAEILRVWKSKFDFRTVAAILLPLVVVVLHLPLIRAAQPFIRHFWSKAGRDTLFHYYFDVISELAPVLLLCIVCCILFAARRQLHVRSWQLPTRWHDEWIIAVGLALLPGFVILASVFTFKVFNDRYVLWAAIGIAICLTAALYNLVSGSRQVAGIVLLPLLLWSIQTAFQATTVPPGFRWAGDLPNLLRDVPAEPKPIVITGAHAFMELWFYSQRDLQQRLVYLLDADLELGYTDTDTTTLLFAAVRRRVPLPAIDFDEFITSNPQFIVAGNRDDWILRHLRNLHYKVVLLRDTGQNKMYEVYAQ